MKQYIYRNNSINKNDARTLNKIELTKYKAYMVRHHDIIYHETVERAAVAAHQDPIYLLTPHSTTEHI